MPVITRIAIVVAWLIGALMITLAVAAIVGGAAQVGGLVILSMVFIGLLVLGGRRKRFREHQRRSAG